MVSIKGFTDYVSSFTVAQKAGQVLNSLNCWKKEKEHLTEVDVETERQFDESIRAKELYLAGNREEAMSILDAEAGKNNLYALSRRASILLGEGDYNGAYADAADVLALCPWNGGRKTNALHVAGQVFLHDKDPERAYLYFKQASEMDPAWLPAREGMARSELARGHFDEALALAEALLQKGIEHSSASMVECAWEIKGMAHLRKRNVEKALFCFEQMSGESKAKFIAKALKSVK